MANSTREIRRRIRSIGSTKKVTKAMELVSSAKMRRAVQSVLATRAYATRAWALLTNLATRTNPDAHPLLKQREGARIGLVIVSTNRGLVGGFNSILANAIAQFLRSSGAEPTDAEVILLGKRGRSIINRFGLTAAAEFEKADIITNIEEVRPVAKLVIDEYVGGVYDRIILAYTDFISTINQKPRVRQLLPIHRDPALGAIGEGDNAHGNGASMSREYLFEPNADTVLDIVTPRLVEMQLFQAILESTASEHAARMVAMRNASDAAGDLIDDLTLTFNQARQAGITQDLSEISAGRVALERS